MGTSSANSLLGLVAILCCGWCLSSSSWEGLCCVLQLARDCGYCSTWLLFAGDKHCGGNWRCHLRSPPVLECGDWPSQGLEKPRHSLLFSQGWSSFTTGASKFASAAKEGVSNCGVHASTVGMRLWEKGLGVLQADKHGPVYCRGPGTLTIAEGVSFCVRDKPLAKVDLSSCG